MNTQHKYAISLVVLLAGSTASCDAPPLAPEMPSANVLAMARGDPSHRFQFDIALVNQGARELRSQVLAQADRWARVVKGSDLEDIEWEPGTISCGGLEYDFQKDVLDDLLLMVAVVDLNNGPGAGLRITNCGYRESSKLPMIAALKLDIDGLARGDVNELILHGFAHLLGLSGSTWTRLDLLRNSSYQTQGADTHFVGPKAIAAFVSAGGANYQGARVPVENDPTYGTVDGHWRESVFGDELMTPFLAVGTDYLSAITIQSLADIGYTVNLEEADRFILPERSSASASSVQGRNAIDLSGDVLAGPAVFYDRQGRVVRVLRN